MKKQNSLAQHEMINVLKWPVVPTRGRLGSGFSHALTAGSGAARLDGDQTSRNQRVGHLCSDLLLFCMGRVLEFWNLSAIALAEQILIRNKDALRLHVL